MKAKLFFLLGICILSTRMWATGNSEDEQRERAKIQARMDQLTRERANLQVLVENLFRTIGAEMVGYLSGFSEREFDDVKQATNRAAEELRSKVSSIQQTQMPYAPRPLRQEAKGWEISQEIRYHSGLVKPVDRLLVTKTVLPYFDWLRKYRDLANSHILEFIRIAMSEFDISIRNRLFFLLSYASDVAMWDLCVRGFQHNEDAMLRSATLVFPIGDQNQVKAREETIELTLLEASGRAYDSWIKPIPVRQDNLLALQLHKPSDSRLYLKELNDRVRAPSFMSIPLEEVSASALLFECIRRKKEEYALSLLKAYPNLRQKRTSAGYSPLSLASSYGLDKLVMALIEGGDKVLDRDVNGYTALMAAAAANQIEVVRALLAYDSSIEHIRALSLREGDTLDSDESYEMVSSSSQSSSMQRSCSSYIKGFDALDFVGSQQIRDLLEAAVEKSIQTSVDKLRSNA